MVVRFLVKKNRLSRADLTLLLSCREPFYGTTNEVNVGTYVTITASPWPFLPTLVRLAVALGTGAFVGLDANIAVKPVPEPLPSQA